MLRSTSSGSDAIQIAERAALKGEECPKDGNPFHHLKIGVCVHMGNGQGRDVWERWRTEICIDSHRPGWRPQAFWQYDVTQRDVPEYFRTGVDGSTEREPSIMEQAQWLHAHHMLTIAERKRLPKEWFLPSPPTLKVVPNEDR